MPNNNNNNNRKTAATHAGTSKRLHPCDRVYGDGKCDYGESCWFALYPYDACLRFLKGKCDVPNCKEPHVAKPVKQPAAPPPATKVQAKQPTAPAAKGPAKQPAPPATKVQAKQPPAPAAKGAKQPAAESAPSHSHAAKKKPAELTVAVSGGSTMQALTAISEPPTNSVWYSNAVQSAAGNHNDLRRVADAAGDRVLGAVSTQSELGTTEKPRGSMNEKAAPPRNASRCAVPPSPQSAAKGGARCEDWLRSSDIQQRIPNNSPLKQLVDALIEFKEDYITLAMHPCEHDKHFGAGGCGFHGTCMYRYFPRELCLAWLKDVMEGRNPHATRCGKNRRLECSNVHTFEELRARHNGRHQHQHLRASAATTIASDTLEPAFKLNPEKSFADMARSTTTKTTDAATALPTSGLPQHLVFTAPTSPATPLQRSVSKKQRPSKDDAAAASISDSDALGLSTSITRGYDLAKYVSFASEKNFPTADDLCNYDDDEVIKSNLPDLLVRDPNIPPTKEQQNAHLDALYRNRREEFVGPLRLAVHLVWEEWDRVELSTAKQRRFVWENVKARSDELRADVRYYEHVTYQQCAATDAGITLTLEVDVHLDRRRRWNKSFTNGNLLLLSFSQFHCNDVAFDPEGTSLGIICVVVVSTSTKAVKMANGRVVKDFDGGVGVTPVTGTDSKLLARLLSDASLCGQSVWILESTNFYLPYDRTLSCLQATARSQEGPMFDGALLSQASLESSARPPQYLENRTLKLSTAIAASHPNLTFTPTQGAKLPQDALPKWSFELEESIADEWSHRHVLDDTQRDAIVHMLTSKLAIVQGPPGTGKSFVGEKFLQILFENRHQLRKLRPILLLCETNHALDSVLLGLQRYMGEDVFNESVARFGTRTSDPSLENVLVSRIAQGRGKAHVLNTRSTAAAITAIHSLMTSLSDFTWKGDTDNCIRALRWMESSKCFRPLATTSEFDESVVEQLCKQLAAAEAKLHSFVEQQNQRAQEILLDMTQHLDEAAATDSQASDLMIALGIDRKNKADIESAINWIRENSVEDFLRKDLQVLSDVERDCIAYEGLLSGVGSIPKHSENDPGSVGHVVDHLLHWVHEKKKLHPNDLHLDMFCDDLKAHATNLAQLRSEHAYFERASDNIAILETELLGTISTNLSTAKSDVARVKRLMSKSELYLAVQLDDELAETKFAQDTIIPEDTEDGAVSEEDEDTMARRLENQANRDTGDFDAQVVANQVANVAQLSSCVGWTETNPYSALRELASRCLNTVTQEYLSHVSDAKTQNILGLVDLLRDRFLIAGTTTTATRDLAVLRYLQTNVVVVEEAAEVREEGVWACLTEHTEHLILIGDHMQLRPKIATSFIRTAERHGTAVSMMERLVTTLQAPHKTITTQRRMHPALAQLVAPYYKANVGINIVSHPSTVQRPNMSLLPSQPDPSRIAWIPIDNGVEMQTNAGSWMNAAEANAAIRLTMLLRHVYDCGDVFTHHGSSITILTFYSGQRQELESAAKRYNVWFGPKERDLRIKTVDDFQGEESDVIILSTVRTTDERHMLKFIEAENRWCVALSRARSQVYIICSQNLFCAPLQPGRNTLQNRAAGSVHIMKTLYANLIASRPHPDYERLNANAVVAQVCTDSSHATQLSWLQGSTAASFLRCGETCGKRLPCGHACSTKCHDDRSCDARQCNVTKIVRLECGHDQPTHCGSVKLPRCTTVLPDFKCKDCGHSPKQNVLCHQLTSKSYKCKQQCNKKLGCTHRCAMKCHEPCQCTTTVSKALPCGHTQQVLCTVPPSELSTVHCRAVCGGKIGSCGHGCSGECGSCAQLGDGFHVPCNATIKVWTPDGEQRDATCSDPMKPVCNVTDPNLESIAKLCDTRDHDVFTLSAPCTFAGDMKNYLDTFFLPLPAT
ncbi:Hypothetical protein, putative [Bodo saltans]|uniref:Zinc finger protein n=1 Tax=Bodo saltans TaxID=75058 RepID=A0A0S4J478_BODSA|nr:Hypothetical protein, putative [Bodo saltans]|eukprot:CUG40074.1 Hypothetical protein, putative [Bodo saltans]